MLNNAAPAPEFVGRSLVKDRRLLLIIFLMSRLILLVVYQPAMLEGPGSAGIERGLSTWGDLSYHYEIARLGDATVYGEARYPYIDFWYEYPPVFPALSVGLYQMLAARGPAEYGSYATALGMLMIFFDLGTLLLLRRIARRLYGEERAAELAWVYALLPMPLILNFWTFDAMIAFFMLLALALLLEGQLARSGAAIACGILVKFMPIVMLPAVWRFWPRRAALKLTLIALSISALVLGGLVFAFGDWASASFTVQFTKSSYASPWALIDGNMTTGIFGSIIDHFDLEKAATLRGNPAVIPPWLTLLIFGGIGLFVFTRPLRKDDRAVVAFVGITYMLFMLWSSAWSNQWLMWLVPLILLCFPTRNGIMTVLLLGLITFVEYPMLFGHTGDTGGIITGARVPFYYVTVLGRTMIWAALGVGMYRLLRDAPAPLHNSEAHGHRN